MKEYEIAKNFNNSKVTYKSLAKDHVIVVLHLLCMFEYLIRKIFINKICLYVVVFNPEYINNYELFIGDF